jgi:hypothetical protein
MSEDPVVSGPEVPENPVSALLKNPGKKPGKPQRRGAQRTQGPKPEPAAPPNEPPRPSSIVITDRSTTVVGKQNIEGSTDSTVTTETTGPVGYVPTPSPTPPISSGQQVATGEIILLRGVVECEVLGLTRDGRVRLKTCDPAKMGKTEEFCADPGYIVKKAGTP